MDDPLRELLEDLRIVSPSNSSFSPELIANVHRLQRFFGALFRLSFRHPEKMHYEDSERQVVVEYTQQTFRAFRNDIDQGVLPETSLAQLLGRIQKWKRESGHEEL